MGIYNGIYNQWIQPTHKIYHIPKKKVNSQQDPTYLNAEAGDAQGLQIIARSSMNLGYSATDPSAPPVMLHAKVRDGSLAEGSRAWQWSIERMVKNVVKIYGVVEI